MNKIQTFVSLSFGGFQTLSPCGFKVILKKESILFLISQKQMFYFLLHLQPTSLILVFLCNFSYFRFRVFIFVFLVKFGSYYSQELIMIYFRIFFFKFYGAFKQVSKSINVFNNYSINKIQTFVSLLSSGFQTLFPFGFKDPRGFKVILQKQRYFVSYFLEVNVFWFLSFLQPTSVFFIFYLFFLYFSLVN